MPFMETELRCDEKTIIIGHSSGAIAAMRYDPVGLLPQVWSVAMLAGEIVAFLKFPLQRNGADLKSGNLICPNFFLVC